MILRSNWRETSPWLTGCVELPFIATKQTELYRRNICNTAGITLLSTPEKKRDPGSSYSEEKCSQVGASEFLFGMCFSVYTGWSSPHLLCSLSACLQLMLDDWMSVDSLLSKRLFFLCQCQILVWRLLVWWCSLPKFSYLISEILCSFFFAV